ncbi:receptor-like protein EIX2 isoform X2 [Glycine soja]|uniref:receptor-like protein EIX2 isoform X2 n=1 Tax=Glycine soja TaxID=3848 RepID=UPI001038C4C6|nr:receptor-like protein EIX2 isoform X2 [Glycine soja]
MSCYSLKLFYALLLLLLHAVVSILGFNSLPNSAEIKCIESERQALLNFKHGLKDETGMLSTWRDDGNNRDCCKWKGIQCNNQTGHVEMLHLRGHDTQYLIGAINISSLIALENIEHLDLSYNDFEVSHIPELMGLFTNLRYLNLSASSFGGSIPSDIGKLTHLLSLDLGKNLYLHGQIPYQLGNLTHLQYLDLSDNDLEGELPYQLGNLSQLRYLDLCNNFYLHGQIPYQLGNLTHLQYLDLSDNDLDGELPYQLGNLSQLRYLDLARRNSFSGALPFQVGKLPLLHTLGLGGNFDVKSKDAEWLTNLSSLTKLKLSSLHNLSSSHHWLQMISKLIPSLRELRLFDCSLSDTNIQSLFYSPSNLSTALTILDLSSNKLTSSTFQLLSNFPSLVILDLSYNNMSSSVFQGGFNFSSKLQNLDLQNCSLTDGSFLMSSSFIMSSSSSLVSLDLSSNLLKSSTIFYWLFNSTTNLHELSLDHNMLEGPIPDGFGKVMNSLEVLDLSDNKLQGEIPSFFGNMCALQSLDLSNNKLNGEFSSFFRNSSWCNRHIFKSLYLSYNRLTGMLPKSIGLLSELEYLYLAGNSLEGDVTESHLSNFSKLKYLRLSENSLSLKFVPSWVPPFQLIHLGLRSCELGPTFPSWLKTQSSLYELDISDNGINDSVPDWFWNNLEYMAYLNMSFNYIIGAIPNISCKLPYRPFILLNSNQFEGKIPSFLLQASGLMLSENNFSDLFSFLCDQSTAAKFAILDVSHNQIKGQLPDCWKSVKQLLFLDLSNNKLSGKIPMSMGALVNMEALVLRNNSLMGELPSSLKNCSSLFMLDLSENMLSGSIPSWIGESMQQLIILKMRGNHLSGNLPIHLCYLKRIQLLDLSRNNLSSGIPSCLKNLTAMSEQTINSWDTMSHIYWYNNTYIEIYGGYSLGGYTLDITWMWKGVERGFKDPELELKSIDLSCNNLTGEIPNEVGYLLGLVSLNLSRNNLSGEIPSQIGNLGSLESLDLSRNHISGRIPSSLSEIDYLQKLDLSHNSLSGRIPSGRHFETFEASSFEGNIDLCGEQLNKTCPGDGDQTTAEHQEPAVKGDDSVFYEGLYMSLGIGYFTGFWGLLGPLLLWRPWRIAYKRFLNRLTDYVYVCLW